MALSIHAASVSVYVQMLTALDRILDKAVAYAAARKIAPEVLLGARLFPDMLPFTRQVQSATDHARNSAARIAGAEPMRLEFTETTFEELKSRIARTVAYMQGLDVAAFEGAESRMINFTQRGQDVTSTAGEYFLRVALPNFFFHVTTAYDILRHNGLDIGKRDFLGVA